MLDELLNEPRWLPYHGWHDDHRGKDRTAPSEYLPAIQQNRAEFMEFVRVLEEHKINGRCLQLGLGIPGASHVVFQQLFSTVWTMEIDNNTINQFAVRAWAESGGTIEGNSHEHETQNWFKSQLGLYKLDLLFIDAGHKYHDVTQDFNNYAPLVRKGGIIAFHDALKRPTYEDEIEVWKVLDYMKSFYTIHTIGDEIGIAYLIKE